MYVEKKMANKDKASSEISFEQLAKIVNKRYLELEVETAESYVLISQLSSEFNQPRAVIRDCLGISDLFSSTDTVDKS